MLVKNQNPLFKHLQTITLNPSSAEALSRRVHETVYPGDELRLYVDKDGCPAQAVLSPRENRAAVAYRSTTEFLWGTLQEAGGRCLLVGDGDPFVIIDLGDLAFTIHRVE